MRFRSAVLKTPFVALLSMLILTACSEVNKPLKIATHPWPGYEFLHLAHALGKTDPKLVEFVSTTTAPDTLELLRQGKVDGGALTLDEVLRGREQGIPMVVVLVFDISAGADVLLAHPAIDSLNKLKGKRVGVENGAVGAIMLNRALLAANLQRADITPVFLRIDEQIQAWKNGSVDAVITYEPNASQLRALGARQLFSSREAPNLIVDVLAFHPKALQKHAAVQHLVDVHFAAQQHFHLNSIDAGYRMAPRLGVQPQEVDAMFNGLILPNRLSNQRLFSQDAETLNQQTGQILEIMHSAGLLQHNRIPSNLFDGRFVNARAVK